MDFRFKSRSLGIGEGGRRFFVKAVSELVRTPINSFKRIFPGCKWLLWFLQTGLKLYNRLIFQVTAIGLLLTIGGVSLNGADPLSLSVNVKVDNLSAQEYVERYFSDIPVLIEVARCESQFRQKDANGNTLTGKANEFDLGVMQINDMYHSDRAQALGLDLHTIEGNAAYARYLFEKEGLKPWRPSSKCWMRSGAYKEYAEGLQLAVK